MPFTTLIEQISKDFIQAWNQRDLEKVASFLSNNISVKSPNIQRLFPEENESILIGKDKVMTYWIKLNKEYFFHMSLIEFQKSAKTIHVKVEIGIPMKVMYATFVIDEYGKFTTMEIEYRDS